MKPEDILERLQIVTRELGIRYPLMDLTDFHCAMYSLEDDIEEDDDL